MKTKNMITTQIGGKYSRKDLGLFNLKSLLVKSGVVVKFPIGNTIVSSFDGIDLSFDPKESGISFYEMEKQYLKAIKTNSLHIVHNKFQENKGYIGESASIEIGYALVCDKPILLLYKPILTQTVPAFLAKLIRENTSKFYILRLDLWPVSEVYECLRSLLLIRPEYNLDEKDRQMAMVLIRSKLNEYKEVRI